MASEKKKRNPRASGYLRTADVVLRYQDPNGGVLYTEQTLAGWRRNGKGPPWIKPGGTPLYPLADLLKWEKETGLTPVDPA